MRTLVRIFFAKKLSLPVNLHSFLRSDASKQDHLLLLGNPVEHSFSPLMHNTAARILNLDLTYHAVELRADELSTLSAHLNNDFFQGANITIPYKQMLLQYMDELSFTARSIGAINTIVKKESKLLGENTDIFGFSVPLQPYKEVLRNERSIVFGTGGASKAIIQALVDLGMQEIILISRNPANNKYFDDEDRTRVVSYESWGSYAEEAALIINATPLGMHPDIGNSPVRRGEETLLEDKICYDIVYNPPETKFLKQAKSMGAQVIGGLDMLVHQGSKSFELWTGQSFPIDAIKKAIHEKL